MVFVLMGQSRLPNTIAVSSVSEEEKLSRFSNYGVGTVDIAALGKDVEGAWLEGAVVTLSGTSVSAGCS